MTVATLPMDNEVCTANAVFLSVILDRKSSKKIKLPNHKKDAQPR